MRVVVVLLILSVLAYLLFSLSKQDRSAIESRYSLWQTALAQRQFTSAYAIMSPAYRAQTSLGELSSRFRDYGDDLYRPQRGCLIGAGGAPIFARSHPYKVEFFEPLSGPLFFWEKVHGEWFLTGQVDWLLD